MIRTATPTELAAFAPTTAVGHKIKGLFLAYGAGFAFLPFWTDEQGGFGACLSGCALIDAGAQTAAEWACFLQMLPTAQTAETTAAVAENTPAFVFESRPVLTLPPSEGAEIAPPLDKVYALEKAVFGDTMPPFDEWYADMSHRLRHGCGKAAGIYEGETLAGTALVTLTDDAVGIVGGVATAPQSRGKGYARRTVSALAHALQREGKQALIVPKNAHADTLYRRWGATQTDTLYCGERV